jgi:arylsulfatase A-like enzyme
VLVGCQPRTRTPAGEQTGDALRPTRGNIVIALDALRADHLGFYGYDRPTSPFLDSLAARAAVVEWAIAPYPGTLVSNLSLFTGLYPPQHGVYPPSGVLAAEIPTLPELFLAAGFRTAGHTEGGFMAGGYGFASGFEEFTDTAHEAEADIERTFERGLDFLRGLATEEQFFLFLHTYSPHDPYDPPEPYRSELWPGEPPPGPEPVGPTLRAFNAGEIELTPETLAYYRALYDASIRYTDEVLARFFAELEALGLAGETTIVITADHGEELADHGRLGHTQLYPESLRVPLVIIHPELESGLRIPGPVSSVDLAPTLLDLAGISSPEELGGASLRPLLEGAAEQPPRAVYAEVRDLETARALISAEEGGLHQLLAFSPNTEPGGTWISRSVAFDVPAPRVRVEIQSFHQPREIRVSVDGQETARLMAATEWDEFEIDLPRDRGIHRVELATEECESPASLGPSDDARCLSFQIRKTPLHRLELYDLEADPGAKGDLSRSDAELTRRLARRLQQLRWSPVAAAGSQALSEEARETLRALGYLD